MYPCPRSDPDLGSFARWKRRVVGLSKIAGVLVGGLSGVLGACFGCYLLVSGDLAEQLAAQYWRACCGGPLTIGLTALGIIIWRRERSSG